MGEREGGEVEQRVALGGLGPVDDTSDAQDDTDDAPAWKSPDDSGDRRDDKPGKGNGRGHR